MAGARSKSENTVITWDNFPRTIPSIATASVDFEEIVTLFNQASSSFKQAGTISNVIDKNAKIYDAYAKFEKANDKYNNAIIFLRSHPDDIKKKTIDDAKNQANNTKNKLESQSYDSAFQAVQNKKQILKNEQQTIIEKPIILEKLTILKDDHVTSLTSSINTSTHPTKTLSYEADAFDTYARSTLHHDTTYID